MRSYCNLQSYITYNPHCKENKTIYGNLNQVMCLDMGLVSFGRVENPWLNAGGFVRDTENQVTCVHSLLFYQVILCTASGYY